MRTREELEKLIDRAHQNVRLCQDDLEDAQNDLDNAQSELKELQDELEDTQNDLDDALSELEELQDELAALPPEGVADAEYERALARRDPRQISMFGGAKE